MPARFAQLAVASLPAGTAGWHTAISTLIFALVEDDKVTILPAALARRETNPVQ